MIRLCWESCRLARLTLALMARQHMRALRLDNVPDPDGAVVRPGDDEPAVRRERSHCHGVALELLDVIRVLLGWGWTIMPRRKLLQ
jgi:hypothetical protein